jgi:hypothetical protein
MARADASKWEVTNVDAINLDVKIPADDILGKRRDDGKRPFKLPMRKIIAKIRERCPSPKERWDYAYVELDKQGKTCTFRMQRDG